MASPILETDDTRIFYRKGRDGPLLITFSGLAFPASDGGFWGDAAPARTAFSRIGVVARTPHWYPRGDVKLYIDYLREIASRHDEVICCGEDAGGYAALKWSGAIGATVALAFHPHYSIAPEDVGGFDRRHEAHYDPARHAGMAIAQADLCPASYVVYDPYQPRDRRHAALIARHDGVVPVGAAYCADVGAMLVTRDRLADIVAMARRAAPPQRLERRIRMLKKMWPHYYMQLASAAAHRRPALAARLLERARLLDRGNVRILLRLGMLQRQLGRLDMAAETARAAIALQPNAAPGHGLMADIDMARGHLADAHESLETALGINPGMPHLHILLANLLERLGRRTEAITAMEAALRRIPGNPALARHLEALRGDARDGSAEADRAVSQA